MHSIKDCPLRSMAWLTINEDNKVIHATEEMIELLEFNPVNQPLSSIWQPLISPENNPDFDFVSTVSRTLCICTHMNQNSNHRTIICTDITDLKNHMPLNTNISTNNEPAIITRLTMYGTIEAKYSLKSTAISDDCIGQPMMRYIHSEDVRLFCAGLNEATKTNSIAHFQIRLLSNNTDTWSQFTVMLLQDNKVLCFIQPITQQENPVTQIYQCNDVFKRTLCKLQSKFWHAIEHGMNILAKHLASSLIALFQTAWCIWYQNSIKDDHQFIRSWIQSTKESTEIDRICHFVSYLGISHNTTKSWLDHTFDHTSEWLLSKTSTVQYLYDYIL